MAFFRALLHGGLFSYVDWTARPLKELNEGLAF